MIACAICNVEFEDDGKLHRHLRSHDLTIEEYYHAYYPHRDLSTNELIPFKNKNSYLHSVFSERRNCLNYIKNLKADKRIEFLQFLIQTRANEKGLQFAPSEVELRSSILPSLVFLNKLGISYKDIVGNLTIKYDYSIDKLNSVTEPMTFMCDTREQRPLKFPKPHNVIKSCLGFGDYACQSHYKNIFIERKSMQDLIGTLSKGFERFILEVEKAKTLDANLFVLCESPIADVLCFDSIPYIKKFTKLVPEYIFHNIRTLMQEYPNIQFGFCEDRKHMIKVIEKIYTCSEDISKIDLQYAIDIEMI